MQGRIKSGVKQGKRCNQDGRPKHPEKRSREPLITFQNDLTEGNNGGSLSPTDQKKGA